MDHVIYRDYIVNRRFFIYCSLAARTSPAGHEIEGEAVFSAVDSDSDSSLTTKGG